MNPTLKAGDVLYVMPYGSKRIRPGDVILFQQSESARLSAHRVISVDKVGRLRTRGDNNTMDDPWRVQPSEIRGHVVYAARGRVVRRIFGGLLGRLWGLMMRPRRWLWMNILRSLRPVYHHLAGSVVLGRIRSHVKPKVIHFKALENESQLHLLIGDRVVGRLPPGQKRWQINPLFRLLVDEATLPDPVHMVKSPTHDDRERVAHDRSGETSGCENQELRKK